MPFRLESHAEPIPGYKLISRLGGGGFGEVWKAEAPGGLLKAIKFVYGDLQTGDEDRIRAEQELRSLHRIKTVRHPYILSLERYDIINGQLIIVMELADRNLWDRYRECRGQGLPGIPREEMLRYLEESAEALDLMNSEYQLQHLDIKPQNIFLVYNHVKVGDFGLVKDLEGMAASVTGGVTPIYAAPEMFDGWVSRYCDQYSLAIVYQEMLTGQRPFASGNVHQLIMQHMQAKPNLSALPIEEQEVIGRALSKTPEDRFPTCTDMVTALRSKNPSGPVIGVRSSAAIPMAAVREKLNSMLGLNNVHGAEGVDSDLAAPPEALDERVTAPKVAFLEDGEPEADSLARAPTPTEIQGEGELFPAMVIGLGQFGLKALQQLGQTLQKNLGSRDELPHLRLLYLDTDPDAPQAAGLGEEGAALSGREVLLARLNRASHYLKPRDGRPRIDTWFHPNMLYRIQRNQVTAGLRALGRLAFIDNYRSIVQRLRADLQFCTDPSAMATSIQRTGLTMRSNRPRVYIVTSLAGGTGSGMFIDLAYVVRHLLRELGFCPVEVVGIFLLPGLSDSPARTMAMGNAFAALTELNHFSSRETVFAAQYEDRDKPIQHPEAPFSRCIVLPLPPEADEAPLGKIIELVGEYLFRDLTTPLGKAADSLRTATTASVLPPGTMTCQRFGLVRFSWPRRFVLQGCAQRLCERVVQKWVVKDSKPVHEYVQGWVKEKWVSKELGAEFLIARLQAACERALAGRPPEALFATLVEPFHRKGWFGPQIDATALVSAVTQIEETLGHPSASAVLHRPGTLEEALRQEAELAITDWKDRLLKLTWPLMEQPDFRLAGAEAAVRQLMLLIEDVLEKHEPLAREFTDKAAKADEGLQRLQPRVREIVAGGRRTSASLSELVELLRRYPKWRYQSLLLTQLKSIYGGLHTFLADQLREVGFCRNRLTELLQNLASGAASPCVSPQGGGQLLFPNGCRSAEEAVTRFVEGITPTDLEDLDERLQTMIRQQFRGLAHVCGSSSNLFRKLRGALVEEALTFAGARLTGEDVVEMFLSRHPTEEEVVAELEQVFVAAAPLMDGDQAPPRGQVCILATPPSPRQEHLRALAHRAMPQIQWIHAASADDIVFYREECCLRLADLELFGPQGQAAYEQMSTAEHFSPHCRIDILDWNTATAGVS